MGGSFFFYKKIEKEDKTMSKGNVYATNAGGIIKAPNKVKNQPKASVVKGNDLRVKKSK